MVNGTTNTASTSTATSEGASSSAPGSDEEPLLYVNARQYKRILKRRAARAKLHEMGKIPKERPVSNLYNFHLPLNKNSKGSFFFI